MSKTEYCTGNTRYNGPGYNGEACLTFPFVVVFDEVVCTVSVFPVVVSFIVVYCVPCFALMCFESV
jgi:hypothetical protein